MSSSRSYRSRASGGAFGVRNTYRPYDSNYDYTGAGIPDDRTPSGDNRFLPLRENVNSWNNYVGASQRLEELTQSAINAGVARYNMTNQSVIWDRRQDLQRARSLRATIQDYRDNQRDCTAGNQSACNLVGRRDRNDRQYVNPNQTSYRDYFLHNNLEGDIQESSTPGDIMQGGGDVSVDVEPTGETSAPRPAETEQQRQQRARDYEEATGEPMPSDTPPGSVPPAPAGHGQPPRETTAKERCIARGDRWTDDGGGGCFSTAHPVAPDPAPEERTGRQNPDPDHSHRQVDPTASGGGSHSGKDGSKTRAGTDGVIEFDTGTHRQSFPQKNEIKLLLNNLRALKNPYGQQFVLDAPYGLGQNVTCRMKYGNNKRLVE